MAEIKYPTVGASFGTSESSYTVLRELLPSPAWLIREHRPDFHIDYIIEPTEAGELTGVKIGIQLKGWMPRKSKDGPPTYRLKTKHLLYYVEKCEIPVFLVLVDVTHRMGYWVFTQKFGGKLDRNQLRKQTKITVPFSLQDTLADMTRFNQAVLDAVKFMRELRPGSIDAAVLQKQKELEAKDPRVEVQIDLVDGRKNMIVKAKEEIPITLSFKTSDPTTVKGIRDFFEKGTDLEIMPGEIEFKGLPLFQEMQMPKNEKLRIQYRRGGDGHALFSWGDSDPESNVYIPGKCRLGEKYLTFDGNFPGSPFEVTTSLPWSAAHAPKVFSMRFGFHAKHWQNQRLIALPYFESIYRCFKAVVEGKGVVMRLYFQGNLLGASRVTDVVAKNFQGILSFLETLRKARVLAARFQVDPVMPQIKSVVDDELQAIDELHAVLYSNEYRRRVSKFEVSFAAPKPSSGEDFDDTKLLTFVREIHGYRIFGTNFMIGPVVPGPIVEEFTQLKLTQITPAAEPELFNFELRATEGTERVVRYGSAAPVISVPKQV